MKLKRWFFDATAFQKDVTRFAPFWALYLICALLISMPLLSDYSTANGVVRTLNTALAAMGFINLFYAIIAAQLVFGDLFNGRLCNALHALPLRRETWFSTHMLSGLLFCVGPNAVLALIFLGFTGEYPQAALLWMLGADLSYLFFFCLAVLCMQCTGSRFAAVTVYLILNFLAVLLMWFATAIYEPLLYGVQINSDPFLLFVPVVALTDRSYFTLEHDPNCWCQDTPSMEGYYYSYSADCSYIWKGGTGWQYLCTLALVGLALGALALVLYRRRKLESAGDFVAFRKLRPLFWVIFSVCAGWICQFFASDLMGVADSGSYLFFIIGTVVGFFVGHMLLERTIKVFRGKAFVKLVVLFVALGLSLGLVSLDPVGVTRRVPAPEKTEGVLLMEGHRQQDTMKKAYDGQLNYLEYYKFIDYETILQATQLHKQLIQEGEPSRQYETVSIYYRMKDGSSLVRYYKIRYNSKAQSLYKALLGRDQFYPLGTNSLATLQNARIAYLDGFELGSDALLFQVMENIYSDAQNGLLLLENTDHAQHGCHGGEHYLKYTLNGMFYTVTIWPCFTNSYAYADQFVTNNQCLQEDPKAFLEQVEALDSYLGVSKDPGLLKLLAADYDAGTLMIYSPKVLDDWIGVTLWGEKIGSVKAYLSPESQTLQYMEAHLGA